LKNLKIIIDDPVTELAREGARRLLAQALIAGADAFVATWKDLKLPDGRGRVVRHGYGPKRGDPDIRRGGAAAARALGTGNGVRTPGPARWRVRDLNIHPQEQRIRFAIDHRGQE
jgi:hypothetical protein